MFDQVDIARAAKIIAMNAREYREKIIDGEAASFYAKLANKWDNESAVLTSVNRRMNLNLEYEDQFYS